MMICDTARWAEGRSVVFHPARVPVAELATGKVAVFQIAPADLRFIAPFAGGRPHIPFEAFGTDEDFMVLDHGPEA